MTAPAGGLPGHVLTLEPGRDVPGTVSRVAVCSCGWRSDTYRRPAGKRNAADDVEAAAVAAGLDHLATVAGQA